MESISPWMAARIGPIWASRIPSTLRRSWWTPTDSDTVFACATGHLWDDNAERGVYKSTDGGKSWRKVLGGANGSTGCAMLSAGPQDAKTIYASMWDFRRQAWTFRSGGPGSGLFKSTDGGEHWTEFTPANAKGIAARSRTGALQSPWRRRSRRWFTR